jgi:DNA polymerase-1
MRKTALLVDGSGFIYRAFFAFPPLTSDDGRPVGAIYGFCSMLFSLLDKYGDADFFLVVFDFGKKTFRNEIFPEYKANRAETPAELREQFPLSRQVCRALGVTTTEKTNFEADDIIATYSRLLVVNDFDVTIASSDKDIMQLIDKNVSMFDATKSKVIGPEEVFEKYGVYPSQMTYFQALVGDSSDNIPGITGIGPVTAAKLLAEFQTLDGIYENMEVIHPPKLRNRLRQGKANAELSLQLATLKKNVDIDDFSTSLPAIFNYATAIDFLKSMGFSSLLSRVQKKYGASKKAASAELF